jgi:hypothetical protein
MSHGRQIWTWPKFGRFDSEIAETSPGHIYGYIGSGNFKNLSHTQDGSSTTYQLRSAIVVTVHTGQSLTTDTSTLARNEYPYLRDTLARFCQNIIPYPAPDQSMRN